MKALTVWQPWATLVAIGAKRIETRSWSTSYRGPLAIHAAATDRYLYERCGPPDFFVPTELAQAIPGLRWRFNRLPGMVMKNGYRRRPTFRVGDVLLPLGAVVATCRLVDVVRSWQVRFDDGPTWRRDPDRYNVIANRAELTFGDFGFGRYAWLLADVTPLDPPVPAKGRQGLWTWDGRA